jgi:hypothetical protein
VAPGLAVLENGGYHELNQTRRLEEKLEVSAVNNGPFNERRFWKLAQKH